MDRKELMDKKRKIVFATPVVRNMKSLKFIEFLSDEFILKNQIDQEMKKAILIDSVPQFSLSNKCPVNEFHDWIEDKIKDKTRNGQWLVLIHNTKVSIWGRFEISNRIEAIKELIELFGDFYIVDLSLLNLVILFNEEHNYELFITGLTEEKEK